MSLTVQRTVYSPTAAQVLVTFGELGPKFSSPKSHQYARTSPSGSMALALKFTGEFAGVDVRSARMLATGAALEGNSPIFTTTSIQPWGNAPPLAMGVKCTPAGRSEKVRPTMTAQSSFPDGVPGVVSSRCVPPALSTTPL